MMQPILPLRELTFITTNNCTAACTHCIMCCSPGQKYSLSFEKMRSAIDQANEREKLHLVVFTGGEPTLLGEELYQTMRYCRDLGIITRMVTNGWWAKTPEKAKEFVEMLRENGLSEINISVDDYHAPYVPFECIKNAWQACKGAGFLSVVLANSHGINDTLTPETIMQRLNETIPVRKHDEIEKPFSEEPRGEDGTLYMISDASIQKIGRAAQEIRDDNFYQIENEDSLLSRCCLVAKMPAVSYDNRLWACCGIQSASEGTLSLGDLNKESLLDILEKAEDSMMVNAIHYLGPLFLQRFAKEMNPKLSFRDNHCSVCEICEELFSNEEAVKTIKMNYFLLARYIMKREEELEKEMKS